MQMLLFEELASERLHQTLKVSTQTHLVRGEGIDSHVSENI